VAEEKYLRRKEQAVVKDLESAFAAYQRLANQVNSIRTWTVSIMATASGFLLTRSTEMPEAVLTTALGALFAFTILELRERSSMHFIKEEVLNIQMILMEADEKQYERLITSYVFRDLRLMKLTRRQKVAHLVGSLVNWQVCIWYAFWTFALLIAYFFANFVVIPRGD
jgi:hypothetical protein